MKVNYNLKTSIIIFVLFILIILNFGFGDEQVDAEKNSLTEKVINPILAGLKAP